MEGLIVWVDWWMEKDEVDGIEGEWFVIVRREFIVGEE